MRVFFGHSGKDRDFFRNSEIGQFVTDATRNILCVWRSSAARLQYPVILSSGKHTRLAPDFFGLQRPVDCPVQIVVYFSHRRFTRNGCNANIFHISKCALILNTLVAGRFNMVSTPVFLAISARFRWISSRDWAMEGETRH